MKYGLIFISFLFCLESIDKYINQVLIGDISEAIIRLPDYENLYPNNPEVIFLSGLLDVDGNSAKKKFAYISNNHKGSKYSVDAIVKVSEYYYTAGLYMESADWLKKIPQYYPSSENIDQIIDLFINSLIVAGHADSVAYYSEVFKKQFPDTEFKKIALQNENYIKESAEKDVSENQPKGSIEIKDNSAIKDNNPPQKSKNILVRIQNLLDKVKDDLTAPINEYSLQAGAFGKRSNAEQQHEMLLSAGYDTRIESVNSNGILLYTVRIGYFSNRSDAVEEQKKISSVLGINPVIINNE